MSNLGARTLSYRGTRAASPPNLTYNNIRPTPYDNKNYSVGDLWVYTADNGNIRELWYLSSLEGDSDSKGSLAHWIELAATEGPTFYYQGGDVVNGPSGDPAAEVDGIIEIYGDGVGIKTASGGNRITISLEDGGASTVGFNTNVGGQANPDDDGVISIFGANNIYTNTDGPNTVVVNLVNSPSVSGTLTAATGITSTAGNIVAAAGNISTTVGNITSAGTVTAGTGLTVSAGTITLPLVGPGPILVSSGGVMSVSTPGAEGTVLTSTGVTTQPTWQAAASSFTTAHSDAGTDATVAAAALTFAGNSLLIRTSGAGSTLTIGQQTNPTISGTVTLSGLGNGSVVASSAGVLSSVTPGVSGTVLTSTGATTAPIWSATGAAGASSFITNVSGPVSPLAGVISILGGAAGDGVLYKTDGSVANKVLILPGTGSTTNGAVLTGGANPAWNQIIGVGNVSITNANGQITITGTGGAASGLVGATADDGNTAAITAGNIINFIGGGGFIRTTAAVANTLTIGQVTNPTITGAITFSGLGNGVVLSSGAGLLSSSTPGASGTILTSTGAGSAPTWQTPASSFTTAHTGSGDATVAAAALTFAAAGGFLQTTGAGSTVTIGQVTNPTISGNVTFSGLGTGSVIATAGALSVVTPSLANTFLMGKGTGIVPIFGTITGSGAVVVTPGASGIDISVTGVGTGTVQQVNAGNNIVITGTPSVTPTVNLANTIHWGASDATHCTIFSNTFGNSANGTTLWLHSYGEFNAFFGLDAGNQTLTTASSTQNVGIGANSLNTLTTGYNNTGCGHNTLTDCTTGSANSAFGHGALANLVGADDNSAFGTASGQAMTSGTNNCLFGFQSGTSLTTGSANSMYGTQAGALTVTSSSNSFFGYQAGAANTAASNSYFGALSGTVATSAVNNAFFGANSGDSVTTGSQNCLFGRSSGQALTTSSNNSFFGYQSGNAATTATSNTFLGYQTGLVTVTGDQNTFVGHQAGAANVDSGNTFVGYQAGKAATTSTNSTMLGNSAGLATTTGDAVVFIGDSAGVANTSGARNTYLGGSGGGLFVGGAATTGSDNILIGYNAGSNWT